MPNGQISLIGWTIAIILALLFLPLLPFIALLKLIDVIGGNDRVERGHGGPPQRGR